MPSVHTANPSKLNEKCFLDLRNMFSNQEDIRIFFSQNKPTEKNFLALLQDNLTLIKNIYQNRTNFLYIKKTSLRSEKIFLASRKLFLFSDHFLELR